MKIKPILLLTLVFAALSLASLACSVAIPQISEAPSVQEVSIEEAPSVVSEVEPTLSSSSGAAPVNPSLDLISQQEAFISLYQNVSPGVVSVLVASPQGSGQGTGFVIDKEGHIITNFHVVNGAEYIEIGFTSGLHAVAEVIGLDSDSDLAVLKVDISADELHPLKLGDSDAIQVGQIVIAIGNPFGLNSTMTTGIISGLGRTMDSLNQSPGGQPFSTGDLIQTDAAINPGNSGGPLLNLLGEVVGINRSIRTLNVNVDDEPINSGIGFAVSVNILRRVVPSLIANGKYDYPYVGISSPNEITLADAEALGLDRTTGVFISSIVPDGPADNAGLRQGDLIIGINDHEVLQFGDFLSYLFKDTAAGDTVLITLIRNGEELQIDLILGSRP